MTMERLANRLGVSHALYLTILEPPECRSCQFHVSGFKFNLHPSELAFVKLAELT